MNSLLWAGGCLCTQLKSDDLGKKGMNLGPPLADLAAKTKEAVFWGGGGLM